MRFSRQIGTANTSALVFILLTSSTVFDPLLNQNLLRTILIACSAHTEDTLSNQHTYIESW